MTFLRPARGRSIFVLSVLAAGLALHTSSGFAAGTFPYGQDLLLDAAPMRPAKRVPILNVTPDGAATIDLWCKSVSGRVAFSDSAIRIAPGPLPEALPQMRVDGQCTPARLQADYDVLDALAQVTGWRRRGDTVLLNGPRTLRFRVSNH